MDCWCRVRLPLAAVVAAIAAFSTACASAGGVPHPFPTPGAVEAPAAAPAEAGPPGLVASALALQGRPYRMGGSDPDGFDCSGFTQYVFARYGIALPREVRDQYREGHRVKRAGVAPGDLVFFTTVSPGASHVGIAIGDGQFIHAPSTNGVVRVERLESGYWARRFVGARRLW